MENIEKQTTKKTYLTPLCEIDENCNCLTSDVIMSSTMYGDDQEWDGRDLPEFPILDWE